MKNCFILLLLIGIMFFLTACPDPDPNPVNPPSDGPNITSINPLVGNVSDVVTITGRNFGTYRDTNFVLFNGIKASDYISWSDTEIKVTVPQGTVTGNLSVTVNGTKSNEVIFTISSNLSVLIDSVSPNTAKVGESITISGSGFGITKGTVSFSGATATASEIQSWNNTQIIVKVPQGAVSGKLSVTVNGTKSNDVTFTINSNPTDPAVWNAMNSGTSNDLTDICFVDNSTVYVVGKKGTILATSDGGNKWITQNSGNNTVDIWYINFFDNNNGIAFSYAKANKFVTANSGNSWSVSKLNNFNAITGASFVNQNNIWIINQYYDLNLNMWFSINKTTDLGVTWSIVKSGAYMLTSIFMLNENTGWVTGQDAINRKPTVIKTTNGGKDWQGYSNIQELPLFVFFADEKDGWILGSTGGTIFHSNDGGINWIQQTSNTNSTLKSIYFIDKKNGWACGSDGTIIITQDGGNTWVNVDSKTRNLLYKIKFIDLKTGYAVGTNGTILKYTGK
jgi:photosystem II stability/assembly factor-like uncharacterized protein